MKNWVFIEAMKIANFCKSKDSKNTFKLPQGYKDITFQAGFAPSGEPHVGTCFEIFRLDMVRNVFQSITGLPTRLIVVADDLDALKKVNKNLSHEPFLYKWIGFPLCDIPDYEGKYSSFSERFIYQLETILDSADISYELIKNSLEYRQGTYNSAILEIIKNYCDKISPIINSSVGNTRKLTYSPLMPISPYSGRMIEHLDILDIDYCSNKLTFQIPSLALVKKPGLEYSLFNKNIYPDEPLDTPIEVSMLDGNCKLQWKLDWTARSITRNVCYEMHGEDLTDSARVLSKICLILGKKPPIFFRHGLLLNENKKKISKSQANGLSANSILSYLNVNALIFIAFQDPSAQQCFSHDRIPGLMDAYLGFLELFYRQEDWHSKLTNPVLYTFYNKKIPPSTELRYTKILHILSNFSSEYLNNRVFNENFIEDQKEHYTNSMLFNKCSKYYNDFLRNQKTRYQPNTEECQSLRKLLYILIKVIDVNNEKNIQKLLFRVGRENGYDDNIHEWFKMLYNLIIGRSCGPKMSTLFVHLGLTNIAYIINLVTSNFYASRKYTTPKQDIQNKLIICKDKYLNTVNASGGKLGYAWSQYKKITIENNKIQKSDVKNHYYLDILSQVFEGRISISIDDVHHMLENLGKILNGKKERIIIQNDQGLYLIALLGGQASGKTTIKNEFFRKKMCTHEATISVSTSSLIRAIKEWGVKNNDLSDGDIFPFIRNEILYLQLLITYVALYNNLSVILDIHIIEHEQAEKIADIARLMNVKSILISPHVSFQKYYDRVIARGRESQMLVREHLLFHQIFSYNFQYYFKWYFYNTLILDNNFDNDDRNTFFPIFFSQRKSGEELTEVIFDKTKYQFFKNKKFINPEQIIKDVHELKEKCPKKNHLRKKISEYFVVLDDKLQKINSDEIEIESYEKNSESLKVLDVVNPLLFVINHQPYYDKFNNILFSNAYNKKSYSESSHQKSFISFRNFKKTNHFVQREFKSELMNVGIKQGDFKFKGKDLRVDLYAKHYCCEDIRAILNNYNKIIKKLPEYLKGNKNMLNIGDNRCIDFNETKNKAQNYASFLSKNIEKIALSLQNFECYNVVVDEINRSVDLLTNLDHNQSFFRGRRINRTSVFLPLNQPLYATMCFAVISSFMSKEVCVRPPNRVHRVFKKLSNTIQLKEFFPNIKIFYTDREEFIDTIAPLTEAVIFTGKPENGKKIRKKFHRDILFILNGAGHNPLIITRSANIEKSVNSTLRVTLQNQGQDCAAPNSILVQQDILEEFKEKILLRLRDIEKNIGKYRDKTNIIGANTDSHHTTKIANIFFSLKNYCIYGGEINPITGMIKPTVFEKPLSAGGNYSEFFSPVIMLQPYRHDDDLNEYFMNKEYKKNAMYVSFFGDSEYVKNLIEKKLHTKESILYDTDLHETERGFLPYGGLGCDASCLYFKGKRIDGATLPQRDIYQYLISNNLADEEESDGNNVSTHKPLHTDPIRSKETEVTH